MVANRINSYARWQIELPGLSATFSSAELMFSVEQLERVQNGVFTPSSVELMNNFANRTLGWSIMLTK